MDTSKLAEAIMSSLEFNATLITLMLGFHGFAVGRLWPEKRRVPDSRLLWLIPGLALTVGALYLVVSRYKEVATALSRQAVLDYYTEWLNSYWDIYVLLALAMFVSLAGFGVAVKQGDKQDVARVPAHHPPPASAPEQHVIVPPAALRTERTAGGDAGGDRTYTGGAGSQPEASDRRTGPAADPEKSKP